MRIYLDCYPCFLRQALQATRVAGGDEAQQRVVLHRVLDVLQRIDPACTPPEIGDRVHRIVRQELAVDDPYVDLKRISTHEALDLYPRLHELVVTADDELETAVRLSIAGNIIDFGPRGSFDLWETIERVLVQPFAIGDLVPLRERIARAEQVLFLADNAGETVFDRVLIETLPVDTLYAVKGGPALNDATWDDAVAAGLDREATLVSTGSDAPGTVLDRCSAEFRRLYEEAELILAKGQANYETLSGVADGRVFFLLQTKCPVIARDVGVPERSIVVAQGDTSNIGEETRHNENRRFG